MRFSSSSNEPPFGAGATGEDPAGHGHWRDDPGPTGQRRTRTGSRQAQIVRRYPNRHRIRSVAERHTGELVIAAQRGENLTHTMGNVDQEMDEIRRSMSIGDWNSFQAVYQQEAQRAAHRMHEELESIELRGEMTVVLTMVTGLVVLLGGIILYLGWVGAL